MKRVGIFGGTFNPPHLGHVEAAKAFVDKMQLDSLIVIPAFIPPHKEYISNVTCEERLQMCKIAFKDVKNVCVSDIEIVRGGKSYTYLTLQELTHDGEELYFLCGTDMILTMDMWKKPEIIFSLAKICYIRRERNSETTALIDSKCKEYKEVYGARIEAIDSNVIEISSSDIRGAKCDLSAYLSPDVKAYIRDKGLYQ